MWFLSARRAAQARRSNSARPVPEWIDVDRNNLSAKVIALPTREQIEAPVDEQLIVEFYSK